MSERESEITSQVDEDKTSLPSQASSESQLSESRQTITARKEKPYEGTYSREDIYFDHD